MNKLFVLLADVLEKDPSDFHLDSTKDDFAEWDSVATINLAVALEEAYEVSLTAEDVEAINSVRSIVDILGKYGVGFN
jgi:acyl carrier protein